MAGVEGVGAGEGHEPGAVAYDSQLLLEARTVAFPASS